ncbi:glycerol-3-phosphate responsive antiterminator [Brevibacillus ruminantium]|uniref:Glycerol uptake operon antiterminator regulatory protein n=1 Tax=Brevibacillus ruminantium TaxID=2950604 RepID=A0ABY4WG24_9BACL|nr:glycerol-3-phosphate responsive antiterminator [Brevibacillus ruminantium]USG65078.1 glycerol-3-phosphate responsive antiterminator [Brevibacillus ruminantium]
MKFTKNSFFQRLEQHKLIAVLNDPSQIEKVIKYKQNISAATLMTGNILTVKRYIDLLHKEGIPVILHIEKIEGLKADHYGIDFTTEYLKPFAILTTKKNVMKQAKSKGAFVIQMVFLFDTLNYQNVLDSLDDINADMLEIMPCRATDLIAEIVRLSPIPIVTGGLLTDFRYVKEALSTGVASLATSNKEIWKRGVSEFQHG